MNTQQYELLREAYAIIDGIPKKYICMNDIITEVASGAPDTGGGQLAPTCGTIACAMGWLAQHPTFRNLGLSVNVYGDIKLNDKYCEYQDAAMKIFGISYEDADEIFGPVMWDDDRSHKKIFKKRVKKFLKKAEIEINGD